MTPSEDHLKAAGDMDSEFRHGEHVPMLFSENQADTYSRWYARLLTTLAIIAADAEILWGQMRQYEDEGKAEFTVLTRESILIGYVEGLGGDDPKTGVRVIARRSLSELEVHASMAIDQVGSSAHAWPGNVQIAAKYRDPNELIVFVATPDPRTANDKPARVLGLLAELQKDLNS